MRWYNEETNKKPTDGARGAHCILTQADQSEISEILSICLQMQIDLKPCMYIVDTHSKKVLQTESNFFFFFFFYFLECGDLCYPVQKRSTKRTRFQRFDCIYLWRAFALAPHGWLVVWIPQGWIVVYCTYMITSSLNEYTYRSWHWSVRWIFITSNSNASTQDEFMNRKARILSPRHLSEVSFGPKECLGRMFWTPNPRPYIWELPPWIYGSEVQ